MSVENILYREEEQILGNRIELKVFFFLPIKITGKICKYCQKEKRRSWKRRKSKYFWVVGDICEIFVEADWAARVSLSSATQKSRLSKMHTGHQLPPLSLSLCLFFFLCACLFFCLCQYFYLCSMLASCTEATSSHGNRKEGTGDKLSR